MMIFFIFNWLQRFLAVRRCEIFALIFILRLREALDFASIHKTDNPNGLPEVGENKQLFQAIVPVTQFIFQYNNYKPL